MSFSYLSQRSQNQIVSLQDQRSDDLVIVSMPSDQGVIRNGGKNGARFAPKTIVAQFKKLIFHSTDMMKSWQELIINPDDQINFDQYQSNCVQQMKKELAPSPPKTLVQLGGGHDHIYSLLKYLSEHFSMINILNIDAHCDTRQDPANHSGTPFRQFSEEYSGVMNLFQYGIHYSANDAKTLEQFVSSKHQMHLWSFDLVKELSEGFRLLPLELLNQCLNHEAPLILSIDLDAVNGAEFPAVSASAHLGLPLGHLFDIINWYGQHYHQKIMGLYEYNPKLDSLSCTGSRALAKMIYSLVQT